MERERCINDIFDLKGRTEYCEASTIDVELRQSHQWAITSRFVTCWNRKGRYYWLQYFNRNLYLIFLDSTTCLLLLLRWTNKNLLKYCKCISHVTLYVRKVTSTYTAWLEIPSHRRTFAYVGCLHWLPQAACPFKVWKKWRHMMFSYKSP